MTATLQNNTSLAYFPASHYGNLSSQDSTLTTPVQQQSLKATNVAIFDKMVSGNPQKTALISRRGCLTYTDLDDRANRLASHLSSLGVGSHSVVAVALERGTGYIASLLACWKTGATYLPLDQSLPASRMQYMILDSKASCLITIKKVIKAKNVTVPTGHTILLDHEDCIRQLVPVINKSCAPSTGVRDNRYLDYPSQSHLDNASPISQMNSTPVDRKDHDDSLAYIIYTSGTTGNPKGVGITHSNLLNLVDDIRQSREITPTDRVLLFSPLCFDASIRDINGALMLGASLYVPDEEEILPGNLMSTIARGKITNSVITPSVLRSCTFEHLPSLKTLVLAGEAADEHLIRTWGVGRRLINAYGPTEATVCSTKQIYYDGKVPQGRSVANIGNPVVNTTVSIVDENCSSVKHGETGEIWITGPGVSHYGYLNLTELNDDRFTDSRYCFHRTYKTGDLGRLTLKGEVECLGRQSTTRQVKLNGQRIELEEIEGMMRSADYVQDAIVLISGTVPFQRLCAYVVPMSQNSNGDYATLKNNLRDLLRASLPSYSVPGDIDFLHAFPLTVNQKLDSKALQNVVRRERELSYSKGKQSLSSDEKQVAKALLEALDLSADQIVTPCTTYGELGGNLLQASLVLRRLNTSLHSKVQLGQIYRNNISIRQLAKLVSGVQKEQACPPLAILRANAVLPQDIAYSARPYKPHLNRHMLLTGATGFLGCHLLAEILSTNSRMIVTCVVRAPNTDAANERLETALQKWGIWNDDFRSRIRVRCGDVSKPFLGLLVDEYLILARSVDTVYHSAAAVSFIAPYSELEEANVNGTVEILRFASTLTQKRLVYVSTLSVFFEASNNISCGLEIPVDNLEEPLITGYAQTKWVSEQLVQSWANRGGQALILRPGRLLGNTLNFKCPRDDFTVRLIAGIMELGVAPDLGHWLVDLTPVDFCARVTCRLSMSGETGVRHVINQDTISFDTICKHLGENIIRIPYQEWLQRIDQSEHLTPLSSLFHDAVWNGKSTFAALLDMDQFRNSSYESSIGRRGIHLFQGTDELLEEYLRQNRGTFQEVSKL